MEIMNNKDYRAWYEDELNEKIKQLEEENKNLKENIAWYEKEEDRLREENKNLKEKLSEITMVADDEKQSIEHILELEKENRLLKDKLNAFESSKFNTMALLEIQHPKTAREAENLLQYKKVFERLYNDRLYCLEEENRKLKEELDKFSEAYKRYRDYEKEELAESCYDLARENDRLKEEIGKLVMSKSKDN